jgi:spermidine/putrescine transport system permease protein
MARSTDHTGQVSAVDTFRGRVFSFPERFSFPLDRTGVLLALLPVFFLFLFFIAPHIVIVLYSFWSNTIPAPGPPWTLNNYARFFDSPVYLDLLIKSFRIAVSMIAVAIVISFPIAYIIARVVPPQWRVLAIVAIMIPSLTSFLVRTYAWILILNERGLVNSSLLRTGIIENPLPLLYNDFAVFIGLLNVYIPWTVLPIYVALQKIPDNLYEAAHNLGASRFDVWRRVVIPLSMPGVIAAAFLGFIPAIGTYATPMILGGRGGLMYANVINNQFGVANNWPFGAALAMILMAVVLLAIIGYSRFGRVERIWES